MSEAKPATRQKRWQEANPRKRWAHRCLEAALRLGLIERGPCEVCGRAKVDGHHSDYSKPIHVVWLCRRHHAEWHRKNGPGI